MQLVQSHRRLERTWVDFANFGIGISPGESEINFVNLFVGELGEKACSSSASAIGRITFCTVISVPS
jgi:hypothetical protein